MCDGLFKEENLAKPNEILEVMRVLENLSWDSNIQFSCIENIYRIHGREKCWIQTSEKLALYIQTFSHPASWVDLESTRLSNRNHEKFIHWSQFSGSGP